jgi:adenylate cyclase
MLFDHSVTRLLRRIRLISGLILFAYVFLHLSNHALGLISLDTAETALRLAVLLWHSWLGTVLLYGAGLAHIFLAFYSLYQRRTLRLPPAELLRIALGLWLPVLLIGHVAATRISYALFDTVPDYAHIVGGLWLSNAQGRQFGLLAPGWLHGCLGVQFAYNRTTLFRRAKYLLFAVALLVPVLSGLGFVNLGREIVNSPFAVEFKLDYFNPSYLAQRAAIEQWRDQLLFAYACLTGFTLIARSIRNNLEKRRGGVLRLSYPDRNIEVPAGWTVLEASRAYHIPHASMCGGQGRCSTCRVRVVAGQQFCPPAGPTERKTLERINAPSDFRLACQLRPTGSVSLIPLIYAEERNFRMLAPKQAIEREVVLFACDFSAHSWPQDALPEDRFYALTRYVELVGRLLRVNNGVLTHIGTESVDAVFGSRSNLQQACIDALRVCLLIERKLAEIRQSWSGGDWFLRLPLSITIHSGRAVVGEVNSPEGPMLMAFGKTVDDTKRLRASARDARTQGISFLISSAVFERAGVPMPASSISLPEDLQGAFFGSSLDLPDSSVSIPAMANVPAVLRRLWTG